MLWVVGYRKVERMWFFVCVSMKNLTIPSVRRWAGFIDKCNFTTCNLCYLGYTISFVGCDHFLVFLFKGFQIWLS